MPRHREDAKGDPASIMADREPSIEVAAHDDARLRVAGPVGIGQELQVLGAERHGIIIGPRALVGEAADVVEIELGRQGPIGRPGLGGGVRKAGIIAREEGLQDGVGLVERAGPGEAEFTDEPILEGPPEPLDAALRLGGMGGDPVDAQLMQGAADLGQRAGVAAELLVEREGPGAGVIGDDAMPIAVQRDGDAVGADQLTQHHEVARGLFLRPKGRRGHLVGGIVDGAMEHEARPASFEPGVVAAVPLEEQAGLRHALAPTTEAAPAARPRAGDAGRPEPAVDRGPRYGQAVGLSEMLGEVLVVEPGVAGFSQAHDFPVEGVGEAIVWGPATIAVGQRGSAAVAEPGQEASAVSQREPQDLRGLPG